MRFLRSQVSSRISSLVSWTSLLSSIWSLWRRLNCACTIDSKSVRFSNIKCHFIFQYNVSYTIKIKLIWSVSSFSCCSNSYHFLRWAVWVGFLSEGRWVRGYLNSPSAALCVPRTPWCCWHLPPICTTLTVGVSRPGGNHPTRCEQNPQLLTKMKSLTRDIVLMAVLGYIEPVRIYLLRLLLG